MIQTYFNRFEIKYQISLQQRDEIIRKLCPFMHSDSHTQLGGDYEVRSLYYDSPFRKALQEKINGVDYRRKLRIRYYPGNSIGASSSMGFIEIKRKRIENVSKARVLVPLGDALEIVDENSAAARTILARASPPEHATLDEIWFLRRSLHLSPACQVMYRRQAFEGNYERRFRLTFDTNVKVRTAHFDLLDRHGSKYIIPPGMTIMEVKFNEIIPTWAKRLLNTENCSQEKISKFAQGLQKTRTLSLV